MTFGLELWEDVLEVDGWAALVDNEVPTTRGAKQYSGRLPLPCWCR